jgi:hypothetical protein
MTTLRLWKVSGVRMSIQSVGFILSVLVGLNPVEIVFQNVY